MVCKSVSFYKLNVMGLIGCEGIHILGMTGDGGFHGNHCLSSLTCDLALLINRRSSRVIYPHPWGIRYPPAANETPCHSPSQHSHPVRAFDKLEFIILCVAVRCTCICNDCHVVHIVLRVHICACITHICIMHVVITPCMQVLACIVVNMYV